MLVTFTDGVTEALNPEGEEFGEERLKDLLRQVDDDLTFIVMKAQ